MLQDVGVVFPPARFERPNGFGLKLRSNEIAHSHHGSRLKANGVQLGEDHLFEDTLSLLLTQRVFADGGPDALREPHPFECSIGDYVFSPTADPCARFLSDVSG